MPVRKSSHLFLRAILSSAAALVVVTRFALIPPLHAQMAGNQSSEKHDNWPREAVRGSHGMVATDEELASQAGVAATRSTLPSRWRSRWQ